MVFLLVNIACLVYFLLCLCLLLFKFILLVWNINKDDKGSNPPVCDGDKLGTGTELEGFVNICFIFLFIDKLLRGSNG